MDNIVLSNMTQCQFDWAILDLQPVPELDEIGISITLLPENQESWWSNLEYKHIPRNSGIYAIVNTLNGHFYIGSAIDLYKRKGDHFSSLQRNEHHSRYFQRAYNHYGAKAFRFAIVEHAANEDLIAREQHHIDTLNPEYNIARIAGSSLGIKRSDEHRAKTSVASKGRKRKPLSDEQKANISAAKKGKPLSEKNKAGLSAALKGRVAPNKGKPSPNRGKPRSETTIKKMSESLKGKKRGPMPEAARANIRIAQQARRKKEKNS